MSDNSGPAFPCEMPGESRGKAGPTRYRYPGMTLRDYFAAAALQGIFASGRSGNWAKQCYTTADEMLAERINAASRPEEKP